MLLFKMFFDFLFQRFFKRTTGQQVCQRLLKLSKGLGKLFCCGRLAQGWILKNQSLQAQQLLGRFAGVNQGESFQLACL